jgi:hypothetical protein
MNERIKELEKQCWSHRVDGKLVDGQLHFDTQKFSELIVQECVEVCHKMAEDSDSYVVHDGNTCAEQIKQHFGVEE